MLDHVLDQQGRAAEALNEYRRAAKLGDAWSQSVLGRRHIHLQGNGVERDFVETGQWLSQAAGAGQTEARRNAPCADTPNRTCAGSFE